MNLLLIIKKIALGIYWLLHSKSKNSLNKSFFKKLSKTAKYLELYQKIP
jgi:hypothetical protein